MAVRDRFLPVLLAFLGPCGGYGQGLLQRPVEVHAARVRLSEALNMVATDGRFKLSYNAAMFNGDSLVDVDIRTTAGKALSGLTGAGTRQVVSGDHVILVEGEEGGQVFRLDGRVVDAATGAAIARASVYGLQDRKSTGTDANGAFSIELLAQHGRGAVLIARAGYNDTIVYADRSGLPGPVRLMPREKLPYMEPLCVYDRCAVEDLGAARLLVSNERLDAAGNLSLSEDRAIQFSVWPGIGTNGKVGGAFVNHASVNFLGGYAKGVKGAEFGVGVNIIRRDVKGVQFAGVSNLVGGHTNGVQFAGAINHTMRSLEGLQIAGLGNTVWDTLSGAQVAGGVNVVKGGMRGTQISGAANITTQGCDGAQISGGFNVTVKEVRKTQISGGANYGRQVSGAQISGGINVSIGQVGGGQVAGGINYARQVTGGQVAAGVNVVIDTVIGGQVGVLNFARVCAGGQVGILNFSDTITGSSVGLISFAWRGYHRFDLSTTDVLPLTLTFRTGTRVFYNVLAWSPPVDDTERWGFSYGFGTEPKLSEHSALNIELTAEHVNEQPEWIDAVNILGRFSLHYSVTLGRRLVLSAGPSFNVLTSDWRDAETGAYRSTLAPGSLLIDDVSGDQRIQGWIGYRAGIGVRF